MDREKPKLIVIGGPTATGKSTLAVDLALRLNGEIISADSVQVYRGMDIGSAKVTAEEMRGVPHHLIDIMDINQEYNAVCFKRMGQAAAEDITARGRLPIVCGGTGFYIQALLYDIGFEDEDAGSCDRSYRNELESMCTLYGAGYLRDMLCKLDPYTSGTLDMANTKKVIRALEFYHFHGYSFRKHNEEQAARRGRAMSPYDFIFFVLFGDRQKMYDRIDKRVDMMIEAGLPDEVKRLRDGGLSRDLAAGQAIGYKELLAYLDGESDLCEAAEKIRTNTRHFAKRQLTWFRREKDAIWIDTDKGNTIDEVMQYVQGIWHM